MYLPRSKPCPTCGRDVPVANLTQHCQSHDMPDEVPTLTAPCNRCGDSHSLDKLFLVVTPSPRLLCSTCLGASLQQLVS